VASFRAQLVSTYQGESDAYGTLRGIFRRRVCPCWVGPNFLGL